jgi:hypothetical protein
MLPKKIALINTNQERKEYNQVTKIVKHNDVINWERNVHLASWVWVTSRERTRVRL